MTSYPGRTLFGRPMRGGALLALALSALLGARAAHAQGSVPRSLTLGDAARLAASQNASVLAARYRADQAEARAQQQRASLLPHISAMALRSGRSFNTATFGIPLPGFNPTGEVIGPVNTFDARGQLSQTIFDASALRRVGSARTSARASVADADAAAEEAATAAASAYLTTLRAAARVDARLADSVLADSLVTIAEEQTRSGVGVALDVTRAKAQLAGIRAQLIAARNGLDRARLELLRSLGLPLDARVELADSLASLPLRDTLPGEAVAVERARLGRADLRAAERSLRATEQSVSAIRAERFPTLSAFGDEGWIGGGGIEHLLNTYTWGVQLSLPIFDGFGRSSRVEEQEARAKELDVRRRDLRQEIAVEVRGALLDLASAREQVDAARERLRLAEQEVAQAGERFVAGVAGNADVITASLALNSSRDLVIDALTAYQAARVALARAQGSVTELP